MIHPVTVTEASRLASRLRKDKNPLYSVKDYFGSMRHTRNDSAIARAPEGLESTLLQSVRSNSSGNGSVTNAQQDTPQLLRVHTKGALLTSGFVYHPGLSELKVHRIMWEIFTSQIVEAAKLSPAERAMVWAAAVPISPSKSYHKGRNMSQRYQVVRVKEGLLDQSEGSLGDVLQQWNEGYFVERGLLAHLELCETSQDISSPGSQMPQHEAIWARPREDWRAERKFSLVITKADEQQESAEELYEACASSESHLSNESHTSDCAVSPLSPEFKPWPDMPVSANRRLDVATQTNNLDSPPAYQPPPATQLAELEGDRGHTVFTDQPPVTHSAGIEETHANAEDPPVLTLDEPFGHAWAVDWPLTPVSPPRDWPLTPLNTESDWPLTPVASPGTKPFSVHPALALEARHEGRGLGVCRPTLAHMSSSDDDLIEEHPMSYRSQLLHGQVSSEPIPGPMVSFFMPLNLKPFSSTLDFDPQLVSQQVATAH